MLGRKRGPTYYTDIHHTEISIELPWLVSPRFARSPINNYHYVLTHCSISSLIETEIRAICLAVTKIGYSGINMLCPNNLLIDEEICARVKTLVELISSKKYIYLI